MWRVWVFALCVAMTVVMIYTAFLPHNSTGFIVWCTVMACWNGYNAVTLGKQILAKLNA